MGEGVLASHSQGQEHHPKAFSSGTPLWSHSISPWDLYSSNQYFLSTHCDSNPLLGGEINQAWFPQGGHKLRWK